MERIVLCGKPHGCCCVVERINNDTYTITDDFGGMVKIKAEEMQVLKDSNLDDLHIKEQAMF